MVGLRGVLTAIHSLVLIEENNFNKITYTKAVSMFWSGRKRAAFLLLNHIIPYI